MSNSYQSEIPKARVNIQLSVHTGGVQKKVELPLKLLVVGDYSNGAEQRPVSIHYGLNCIIEERFYDALVTACLLPDTGARNIDSLLNQQILPVLSQQLLGHIAAKQKTSTLRLSWDDKEGIVLAFDELIKGVRQ